LRYSADYLNPLFAILCYLWQPATVFTDLPINTKNYKLESLKYILEKEGFYNCFVVLIIGYRKIKKDIIFLFPVASDILGLLNIYWKILFIGG